MKFRLKKLSRLFETTQKRRLRLGREMAKSFGNTIRYGPFKGFRLSTPSWGGSDRSSMLLGLYEQEVLKVLEDEHKHFSVLIDLGAADGYYGIGTLVNRMFQKSYCFEATQRSRDALANNAKNNGVEEKVVIFGMADRDFYKQIPQEDFKKSLVIVDIEGGEFQILDAETFVSFSKSVFVIELHEDGCRTDGKVQALCDHANKTHLIEFVSTGARDLSVFPELKSFKDTDRWLICSESRPYLMRWLVLRPRPSTHS